MITVQVIIEAPVEIVWNKWTTPEDIMQWNAASDDWHTTKATIDLKVGGKFTSRMEAKDGSIGFDFKGVYTAIEPYKIIEYKLEDDRKVSIKFDYNDGKTTVIEEFEAEDTNPLDMQRMGWQAILNNFKKHVVNN